MVIKNRQKMEKAKEISSSDKNTLEISSKVVLT